ncbi:MAG TPA: YceI family protein [Candidatus Acidoferrales bacterium]|nr:YceI family protein [Candidatus Acidoferrales bacterium]
MAFKKWCKVFGIAALFLAICAQASIGTAATERRANPTQDRPASEELPAPGTYEIDPDHTFAYFGARHHVVGLVRGRFDKVTGTFIVSRNLADCGVDVTIDVSSISTQNTERDADLRSPAYFDVQKFPTMAYHGRGIRRMSPTTWAMDGSLTMHGVTMIVPLTFTFNGAFSDIKPGKPARLAFHAFAATKRAGFGIGARDNLKELGSLTTPDVAIEIDVEADEKQPAH